MRPNLGPQVGSTAAANVTSPTANALGSAFKHVGRGAVGASLAYDAYDIATSCKPFRTLMSVSFGILGSLGGGIAGATGGSFVAPVVGKVGGGIAGAAFG